MHHRIQSCNFVHIFQEYHPTSCSNRQISYLYPPLSGYTSPTTAAALGCPAQAAGSTAVQTRHRRGGSAGNGHALMRSTINTSPPSAWWGSSGHPNSICGSSNSVATAGKLVPLKHHGLSLHQARWVTLNKLEAPAMHGARRTVTKHGDGLSLHRVTTRELALSDHAAAASGIPQANGRCHPPRTRRLKGSRLTPGGLFLALSSALGGRTIWMVALPSSPAYTTALTPPS